MYVKLNDFEKMQGYLRGLVYGVKKVGKPSHDEKIVRRKFNEIVPNWANDERQRALVMPPPAEVPEDVRDWPVKFQAVQ